MSFGVSNRKGQFLRLAISEGGDGLIIWCKDIMSMGEPPRREYRCSFAVAFEPETALDVILAFCPIGTEVTDVTSQCRIYDGNQTEPDPLIEQSCGPGAPAFRGTKYVVFENILLAPFGNSIPWIYAGKPE